MSAAVEQSFRYLIMRAKRENNTKLASQLEEKFEEYLILYKEDEENV